MAPETTNDWQIVVALGRTIRCGPNLMLSRRHAPITAPQPGR